MPVVIQGRLARENDQLVCDVITLKVMPSDLDRVDQAIAGLSTKDFENRKAWAAWADARGRAFKDNALLQRARSLEEEALRLEGERKSATVDAPKELLALAEEGRRRQIAEPEPSALAHKALQSRLAAANSSDGLKEVIASIEHFFPEAAKDQASGRINLGRWSQATRTTHELPTAPLPSICAGRSTAGSGRRKRQAPGGSSRRRPALGHRTGIKS